MCYSKLTFKGTSPVINEPYKFFYLKVTGETKMRQNMDMNFEQTSTIPQYSSVVPIILKRWMLPLTRKLLNFSHRIIVLCKYVITIFSFHWFCVVVATHSVVKDSLWVWLCCLSCGSICFRHHSWCSLFVVDRFELYCTRSSFFTCYPGYVRNNFMFILWSISYSLQGTGCS